MIGPVVLSGRKGGKMHNLNRESELELARFGEYLLKSRIVAEKHARYYVAWVRRFLSQVPGRKGVTLEDRRIRCGEEAHSVTALLVSHRTDVS
jgi:hypothetical protein